jgi:DNA-binding SARP family transcriptional activator
VWCPGRRPVVELRLLGRAEVRIDGRAVDHRNWDRARVRELCLHLSLVRTAPRDLVAQRLWPDLTSDAAARNLRVTLSYLLDVLEPERPKGKGSRLVIDRGSLTFADVDDLRIDVRQQVDAARTVLDALGMANEADVVSSARHLLQVDGGPLLGGAAAGEWLEVHDEERRSAVLRAVAGAGPVALASGHPDVAEGLGRLGLVEDPWAERLHQLVVLACLARDDLDGARRALRQALTVLDELGVRPERRTGDLARRLGMSIG